MRYEFEFFECNGRTLFGPITDEARELCKRMRRKNLMQPDIEHFANTGLKITIRPRISFDRKLLDMVKYESDIV